MLEEYLLIRKKATKGMLWVTLSNGIVQLAKFITKIVLARILLPEDFGIVTIGLFVIGGFSLLQGFGINTSLIQKKHNVEEAANTAFFLVLLIGTFLFALAFLTSGITARFLNNPEAASIIKVLSLSFIIVSFELVPSAILTRELKFARRFIAEVVSTIVFAVVSITMSFYGGGYWSLIYGHLSSLVVNALFMWYLCNFKPSFNFNRKAAWELLSYGKFIASSAVISFLITQCDNLVVGKFLGLSALGFYSMAYMISNLPSVNISLVVSGAMYPVFSRLQENSEKLKQTFIKSLKAIMIVVLPISSGMISLSDELIRLLLGEKWMPMSWALRVLSIFVIFRSVQNLTGLMLQAIGEAKAELSNAVFEACFMAVAILPLTINYHIVGTSIAVTLMILSGCLRLLIITKKMILLKISDFVDIFRSSIISSVVMLVYLLSIKLFFAHPVVNLMGLILMVSTGALVYLGVLALVDRKFISEEISLLKACFI